MIPNGVEVRALARTADILLTRFDWETPRAGEDFIFFTIGLLRNQLAGEGWLVALRDRARSMCDAPGKAIGRACAQRGP